MECEEVSTEMKRMKFPNGKFTIESRGHYGRNEESRWVCIQPWFGLFFTNTDDEHPVFGVNNKSKETDVLLTTKNNYYQTSSSTHYKTCKTFEDACKKRGVPKSLIDSFFEEHQKLTSV